FEPYSAVTEGVARVRGIIKEAEDRLKYEGRGTILFCDEIHRFNRAQQDAFLPWVENGIVTLIGATTENPSFELTGALLSRCRVFVLEPLTEDHIKTVVRRALEDKDRGLGALGLTVDDDPLALLAREAGGDPRRTRGGGTRQAGRSRVALDYSAGAGREPVPRQSSRRATARTADGVPRDRTQLEPRVHGIRARDASRRGPSGGSRAAAHPERT